MHPADAADIIEHLSQNDRENLIKINNFKIDPSFCWIKWVSPNWNNKISFFRCNCENTKNLESDDAIAILENVEEKDKNSILSALPPKDRFALLEGLSYPEDSAARIMEENLPPFLVIGQSVKQLII